MIWMRRSARRMKKITPYSLGGDDNSINEERSGL
jgi:hypothetical protein